MEYILKDRYVRPMMDIVHSIASLSYAEKKKVGAILLKDNRIIAQGFNGTPKGTDNCCEEIQYREDYVYRCDNADCPTNHVDEEFFNDGDSGNFCTYCEGVGSIYEEAILLPTTRLVTRANVIHAEENVILQCAEQGISTRDTIMVCTDSPCEKCARMIVQCGIRTVYYERLHDLGVGISYLLSETEVRVFRMEEGASVPVEETPETLKYNWRARK